MKKRNLLFFALTVLLNSYADAQEIINGGFEILSQKSIARNWIIEKGKSVYNINVDSSEKHSGKYALRLTDASITANSAKNEVLIANTYGMASAEKVFTVEISAWVKYSNAADSTIALFFQPVMGKKIVGTYVKDAHQAGQKWQQIKLTFQAGQNSPVYGFYYGFEISAKGKIWMDDIEIKVNGKKITDPDGFKFEPTAKDIKWLNANLNPLKLNNIGDLQKDLIPIGKFAGSSRIVSLGEPTHGTHEAFEFKLSAIQYLVEHKGFTTIALEEVIPTCDIMNQVVNTNNISIKDSLMSLPFYKLYKTGELVELLEWVSNYNRKNPDRKVKFIGMDMEDIQIKTSRRLLRDYGKQHNQEVYLSIRKIDDHLDSLLTINRNGAKQEDVIKAANQLKTDFNELSAMLEKESMGNSDHQLLFNLRTYVRVCEQWLASRFYTGDRDKFMAENIKFYVDNFPTEKLIVWAHNFHVANQPNPLTKTMGAYLKDFYKNDVVSIGFTSAKGSYTAAHDYLQKKWGVYQLENAYRGTYEYILAKANRDSYFLPLNQKGTNMPQALWLSIPMKHLDNGYIQSGTDDDYKFYGNLNEVFDGIVFCKETTASHSYLIK